MGNKSGNVPQETTMADIPAMTLAQYCPDLESWPQRWQYDEHDLPIGRDIVECLRPFLLDLLTRELTPKTLRRHRDNLWLLGGELIRRRYEDTSLKKLPAQQAIAELIEPDGGPLIWPRITQTDQDSLDATCRRLYKFLEAREKTAAKR
jgi:hypothetical protein